MTMVLTPIVLGQRFRQLDGRNQEQVVTVTQLDQDALGLSRVVFEAPGGREIRAYAAQIEVAIAAGELVPAEDRHGVVFAIEPGVKLAS